MPDDLVTRLRRQIAQTEREWFCWPRDTRGQRARWWLAYLCFDTRDALFAARGSVLCRVLHLHGASCRGRTDHLGPGLDRGRWLHPHRSLYFRYIAPWWGQFGVLLKRAGCRIVIGPGHYFGGDQPRAHEGVLSCRSCGHYVTTVRRDRVTP